MQFNFTETRDDEGGAMEFVAENPAEVVDLFKHFRLDKGTPDSVLAMAEAIQAGNFSFRSEGKRPWYRVESAIDHEFTKPYAEMLQRVTGWDGQLPNMDLTDQHPRRLCHTHITHAFGLEHGHFTFDVSVESQDWNDKPAFDRAQKNALDYAENDIAERPIESEYIPAGRSGLMKRNPDYARKHHRCKPSVSADWVWVAIVEWWLANHATDRQRAIVEGARELAAESKLADPLRYSGCISGFYFPEKGGTVNWGRDREVAHISPADFAQLANEHA